MDTIGNSVDVEPRLQTAPSLASVARPGPYPDIVAYDQARRIETPGNAEYAEVALPGIDSLPKFENFVRDYTDQTQTAKLEPYTVESPSISRISAFYKSLHPGRNVEMSAEPGQRRMLSNGENMNQAEQPRAPYRCRKCRSHGENSTVKDHKKNCPYAYCTCQACGLVDRSRQIVARQIALYREQRGCKQSSVSALNTRHQAPSAGTTDFNPHCRRCRNHGSNQKWRGHKKNCPYKDCPCSQCMLITQRKNNEQCLREITPYKVNDAAEGRGQLRPRTKLRKSIQRSLRSEPIILPVAITDSKVIAVNPVSLHSIEMRPTSWESATESHGYHFDSTYSTDSNRLYASLVPCSTTWATSTTTAFTGMPATPMAETSGEERANLVPIMAAVMMQNCSHHADYAMADSFDQVVTASAANINVNAIADNSSACTTSTSSPHTSIGSNASAAVIPSPLNEVCYENYCQLAAERGSEFGAHHQPHQPAAAQHSQHKCVATDYVSAQ